MAQLHVCLHVGSAQIEVSILEPQVLVDVLYMLVDLKGRRLGLGKDLESFGRQLDIAGRQVWIDGPLLAPPNPARNAQHVFAAQALSLVVCLLRDLGTEDHLGEPRRVAKIDERYAAVVATRVDPPAKCNAFALMRGAKVAAPMGPHHGRTRAIRDSMGIRSCSPEARSRSVTSLEASSSSPMIAANRAPERSASFI
jgi:hypothetical protein